MELRPKDVSLLERCPHFRGCYAQASMELGSEDVSLLERHPHFRGCYVQATMELGSEDVSLLERRPHFRGCYVQGWDRSEDVHIPVSFVTAHTHVHIVELSPTSPTLRGALLRGLFFLRLRK